jgi:hypothetical protein
LPVARPARPACGRGTAPATNKKNAAQGRVFDGGDPGCAVVSWSSSCTT